MKASHWLKIFLITYYLNPTNEVDYISNLDIRYELNYFYIHLDY